MKSAFIRTAKWYICVVALFAVACSEQANPGVETEENASGPGIADEIVVASDDDGNIENDDVEAEPPADETMSAEAIEGNLAVAISENALIDIRQQIAIVEEHIEEEGHIVGFTNAIRPE